VLAGDDVYWLESRPTEAGRSVIVRRRPDGSTADINPAPLNARTRVHEYGGADYIVHDDAVYFANFADQRLYRTQPGAEPAPLTHTDGMRYADAVIDAARNRLICVREDHSGPGEAVNTLAAVDLDSGRETVLVSGHDFFAYPRISPDGEQLAWIAWDHPNMPWDGTELYVARIEDDGSLGHALAIAGSASDSVVQPQWSPDGRLAFVSDLSGWWNLYIWQAGYVEPVTQLEAEFAKPLWQLGASSYAFHGPDRIICTFCVRGTWRLASIDLETYALTDIDTPFTDFGGVHVAGGRAVFTAGSPTQRAALFSLDLGSPSPRAEKGPGGEVPPAFTVLKSSSDTAIDARYVSQPENIEFPTTLAGQPTNAFAFYYPPRNADYEDASALQMPGASAPGGATLPPLLVMSHGGPTAATSSVFSPIVQYWTSRGIAVLDVNYGGSTGYGTAYRRRLKDRWGIVDVDDCVNGARYLVARGRVDPKRLAITGGSAGGYTTLCALTLRDTFSAGASYYGVAELEALARDTHKFESRYLDGLIGPYPERRDLYVERSPLTHVESLACPVIFFQGLEDQIVPPNQAEMMVEALRRKGLPVAYFTFEGEQHGFRRAENIKRSLEAELLFYGRIFGFTPADDIAPFEIENLP
jgi:dipeptidyl aminopeptidase/acylaminoacyl peptidase